MLPFWRLPKWLQGALLAIAFCLGLGLVGVTAALAQDAPTFVVALDKLDNDGVYARTVLVATPLPRGGHFGLILNKPTEHTMAALFPSDEPSKAVRDPVYRGGPRGAQLIVAMTRADESPGPGSLQIMPGVWVATQAPVVDAIIASKPNDARYFAGYVMWKPGELAEEVRRGLMALRPADAAKIMPVDASSMYEELVPPGRKPIIES